MRYREWVDGEGPDWKQVGGPTEKTFKWDVGNIGKQHIRGRLTE